METKAHTWTVYRDKDGDPAYGIAIRVELVHVRNCIESIDMAKNEHTWTVYHDKDGIGIRDNCRFVGAGEGDLDAEMNANNLLLDAAPELLDSLHQTLDIVEAEYASDPEPEDLPGWARAIEKARAAIAKAVPSIQFGGSKPHF